MRIMIVGKNTLGMNIQIIQLLSIKIIKNEFYKFGRQNKQNIVE